jgi:hypothetical protein
MTFAEHTLRAAETPTLKDAHMSGLCLTSL